MLTHDNIWFNVKSALRYYDLGPTDVTLSFLPLSHILERMAGHYGVETITVKNLQVVKVEESNLIVSGTVPGGRNGLLILTKI